MELACDVTAEDYLRVAQDLLPKGWAWPRDDGTTLAAFWAAVGAEFAKSHLRGCDLLRESIGCSALELLPDFERMLGLPDECSSPADTIAERQSAVCAKLAARGGQSRAYFINVALQLGFVVTITEFRPFTCVSECDDPLYDEEWRFAWQVNAPEQTVRDMTCVSGCDEPLRDWGNAVLECVITRLKPAHTHVLFAYGA